MQYLITMPVVLVLAMCGSANAQTQLIYKGKVPLEKVNLCDGKFYVVEAGWKKTLGSIRSNGDVIFADGTANGKLNGHCDKTGWFTDLRSEAGPPAKYI